MLSRRKVILFIVTFILFSIEGLSHFCVGKGEYELPKGYDLVKVLSIVIVFAFINSMISDYLLK